MIYNYTVGAPDLGQLFHKRCKKCGSRYHFGWHLKHNECIFGMKRHDSEIWVTSSNTAWNVSRVDELASEMFLHASTSQGLESQLNYEFFWDNHDSSHMEDDNEEDNDDDDDIDKDEKDSKKNDDLQELFNKRRYPTRFQIQKACFQYMIHKISIEITGDVKILTCKSFSKLNDYIDDIKESMTDAYENKFCHEHLLDPKIHASLKSIIKRLHYDGHMKCRRQVMWLYPCTIHYLVFCKLHPCTKTPYIM